MGRRHALVPVGRCHKTLVILMVVITVLLLLLLSWPHLPHQHLRLRLLQVSARPHGTDVVEVPAILVQLVVPLAIHVIGRILGTPSVFLTTTHLHLQHLRLRLCPLQASARPDGGSVVGETAILVQHVVPLAIHVIGRMLGTPSAVLTGDCSLSWRLNRPQKTVKRQISMYDLFEGFGTVSARHKLLALL